MIEIAMQTRSLLVEPARFPPGYGVRTFRAGDAATWLDLQRATGIYPGLAPDLHEREFGSFPAGRQFFVTRREVAIATGTAWQGQPLRGKEWGRLHWIAVHPAHQRRRIAFNLCLHLLTVLREQQCVGAYLTTGSENWPAIALYRELGFVPWIRTDQEAAFWGSVASRGGMS